MSKVGARPGDVFRIPLKDGLHVIGQVLARDANTILVATFQPEARGAPLDGDIDLAGVVFDAKFHNGDWPIVGHHPLAVNSNLWFSAGRSDLGTLQVFDYSGGVRRASSPEEAGRYPHLFVSAPMVFQMAVAAAYGQGEWKASFEHFREYARQLAAAGKTLSC